MITVKNLVSEASEMTLAVIDGSYFKVRKIPDAILYKRVSSWWPSGEYKIFILTEDDCETVECLMNSMRDQFSDFMDYCENIVEGNF